MNKKDLQGHMAPCSASFLNRQPFGSLKILYSIPPVKLGIEMWENEDKSCFYIQKIVNALIQSSLKIGISHDRFQLKQRTKIYTNQPYVQQLLS